MNDSISDTVIEMRKFANDLVHLTYPIVALEEEQDILILKQKQIYIDGYYLLLCFSRSQYENHFLETLQIQAAHSTFLPFNLICGLGKKFFKNQIVCYADFFKFNKKIYCWSSKIVDNKSVPFKDSEHFLNYEGYSFYYLKPDSLKLF